jgi:hypothetical protein
VVIDISGESVVIPVKIDDVVIGTATITAGQSLQIEVTTKSSRSYLIEGILLGLFDSISIRPDFYPPDEVPAPLRTGHLRLLKNLNL